VKLFLRQPLEKFIPKSTFEPYVLWRVAPANPLLPEEVGHGHLNEVTIGLHWRGELPDDFDYDTEFDGQQGSLGEYSINAWAGFADIGKTFPKGALSPRLFLEGNYASGTKNPHGHGFIAAASIKREGKHTERAAREIVT